MQKYVVDTITLRKLMVEKGFNTISALAKEANISRNTLGKILDGSARPSADVMDKLSVALDMTPETSGRVFFAPNLRGA